MPIYRITCLSQMGNTGYKLKHSYPDRQIRSRVDDMEVAGTGREAAVQSVAADLGVSRRAVYRRIAAANRINHIWRSTQ